MDVVVGPLWEQLESEAPWLFKELGLKTVYSDYDRKHMGDSIAILKSDRLRLRFVRDKSQNFCDIACLDEPDKWWPLSELLALMYGLSPAETDQFTLTWRFELTPMLSALHAGFPEILNRFTTQWAQTKPALEQRRTELRRHCMELLSKTPVHVSRIGPFRRLWHHLLAKLKLDPYS
jgi:hypothetical protein